MRRAWGAVLAAVLVGAAGCADDDAAPGLSPPGTPLAAGLEVPVGTQLVGPVFPRTSQQTERARALSPVTSDVAVMQVDGDPFEAWDDIAGQARELGVPVSGSGSCEWQSGGPTRTQTPVILPVLTDPDVLDCRAYEEGALEDGTQVVIAMRLWWSGEGAELHLEVSQGGSGDAPRSQGSFGPRLPPTARELLPERDEPTEIGTGDPFGRENNCFETGYDQLTLPDGARLVGGGNTAGVYDFAAVLAVDDAEAVLEDLRDQLDDPDNSDGSYDLGEEQLADGTTIWALNGGVSAGGGGCDMWSSPDGTAVLVTTTGD